MEHMDLDVKLEDPISQYERPHPKKWRGHGKTRGGDHELRHQFMYPHDTRTEREDAEKTENLIIAYMEQRIPLHP